jgi:putative protein kinase ArgK-like GTPase of G3E family
MLVDLPERDRWTPPIMRTSAATGAGVPELVDAIFEHVLMVEDRRPARW